MRHTLSNFIAAHARRLGLAAAALLVIAAVGGYTRAKTDAAPPTPSTSLTQGCSGTPAHRHVMTISARAITPAKLQAQRCDQLTIVNATYQPALPAFGPHENHIEYPGFEEQFLQPSHSLIFRLQRTGTYPLHDHLNEGLRATITINN